jgi:hypothetical protein
LYGDKGERKESQFLRLKLPVLEQCDKHFWINGVLITDINNAEFLGKVVTSGDMITVLSLVMKANKAIG